MTFSRPDAAGFCYALPQPEDSTQAMKYLLWIGLFLIIYWIMRKSGNRRNRAAARPAPRPPEEMVTCAHCGVHLPVSESIQAGTRHFCCVEHQHAAQDRSD